MSYPPSAAPCPPARAGATAFTVMEIMIAVVMIGLLAALSVPQYLRMRTRSQDAAVLNNARQLAAASSQYFLENGASVVRFDQLAGGTHYLKEFSALAAESYPSHYTQGEPIIVTNIGGARTISYAP